MLLMIFSTRRYMMKKFLIPASIAVCGFCILFSACQQNSASPPPAPSPQASQAPVENPVEEPATGFPAVVLSRASLWTEKEGIMTTPVTQVTRGDSLVWRGEVKDAVSSTDKKTYEYAKVEFDGKEQWIRSVLAAPDATPGVIIGRETVRYTRANLTAVYRDGLTIPEYTIVAIHSSQDSDGFTGVSAFIEIAGQRTTIVKNEFIKKENVTTRPEDVKAMQLYTLALEAKSDVSKREFLRNALDMGSRFTALIEEELSGASETALETEDLDPYEISVIRPGATVYDAPTIRGRNVGLAPNGAYVIVSARTSAEVTLNSGDTARWYKIMEPEGWVFGSYLESNGEQR
jgi:hypothetical protein